MTQQFDGFTEREIWAAAQMTLEARYALALTGAGMSVESGIPPFRGPGGLWTKHGEPPMNGFQIFLADPKKAWEEQLRRRRNDELFMALVEARPNPGHLAFVEMEDLGVLRCVITQNIDNLHRVAGQRSLAEIHGNFTLLRCLECVSRFDFDQMSFDELPPRCPTCGGLLKSDTVAFGEPIPPDVLAVCHEQCARADLMFLAGTSATVYPAAGFALDVKRRGGKLIEVNLYESEITALCDISLRGGAATVLPHLARALGKLRRA